MKKTGFLLAALVIIAGLVFAAGCTGSVSQETPEGIWVLASLGPAAPTGTITLDITGSSVSGNAGINTYHGTVTIDPAAGTLTFGPLVSTRMGGSEDRMQQESAYLAALENAAGYRLENGSLIITDEKGQTLLTFGKAPAADPAGTSWTSPDATLVFGTDGSFSGKGPVNSYFGSFTLTGGDGLILSRTGATLMAGSDTAMQAENAFFEKLGNVTGFTLENGMLKLTDGKGTVLLTFTTPAGAWVLENNSNVTLNLTESGSVSGKAPVNGFSGTFTLSAGNGITFGPLGATLMAGPEADMNAEQELFRNLARVSGYKPENGKLLLTGSDGTVLLTFVQA
jgi:heat shock protein HslJ